MSWRAPRAASILGASRDPASPRLAFLKTGSISLKPIASPISSMRRASRRPAARRVVTWSSRGVYASSSAHDLRAFRGVIAFPRKRFAPRSGAPDETLAAIVANFAVGEESRKAYPARRFVVVRS